MSVQLPVLLELQLLYLTDQITSRFFHIFVFILRCIGKRQEAEFSVGESPINNNHMQAINLTVSQSINQPIKRCYEKQTKSKKKLVATCYAVASISAFHWAFPASNEHLILRALDNGLCCIAGLTRRRWWLISIAQNWCPSAQESQIA